MRLIQLHLFFLDQNGAKRDAVKTGCFSSSTFESAR